MHTFEFQSTTRAKTSYSFNGKTKFIYSSVSHFDWLQPLGLLKGDEACGGNPQVYGNLSSEYLGNLLILQHLTLLSCLESEAVLKIVLEPCGPEISTKLGRF